MTTIFDVAKKAGVSVITVSRLLNTPKKVSAQTGKKIQRVMDELNYQPSQIARSLVSKKTNTIGVIMPDIKNTFFNNWFRFIEEYATAHDFNLILCNTDEDPVKELKYVKLLQSQRVDGVIIAPNSKKSVEYLLKSDICFLLFDRLFSDLKTGFVTTNHRKGAFAATEYLLKLGHKKIAIFRGEGKLYPDIERYSGFEEAMKKYHIKIDKELIFNCEFNEEKAYKVTKELFMKNEKPTAVFTFNSLMAKGVIKYIQNKNYEIPENISLLSFDEIPGHDINPLKVTHIIQPINDLGKKIIVALMEMIKSPDSNKNINISLEPELVIGNSCKML